MNCLRFNDIEPPAALRAGTCIEPDSREELQEQTERSYIGPTGKGEETRLRILERAAPLLNRHGFANAPVSEIMRATGLQKGGLYNHFASKEELSLAAFDHMVERINEKVLEVHRSHSSPLEQLRAHIDLIGSGSTVME